MITPMKKVTLLAPQNKRESVILSLRKCGIVHIDNIVSKTQNAEKIEAVSQKISRVISVLEMYGAEQKKGEETEMEESQLLRLVESLSACIEEERVLGERNRIISSEIDRIRNLGDFNPEDIEELSRLGYKLTFYFVTAKDYEKLVSDSEISFIHIGRSGKSELVAFLNSGLPSYVAVSPVVLPEKSLSQYENELLLNEKRIAEIRALYCSSRHHIAALKAIIRHNDEEILLSRVESSVEECDCVIWISGYIPEEKTQVFKSFCEEEKLGYMIDDPKEEDNPPTLLRHRGFIRFVQPLYDALGLVPGYREKDISPYFLVFMSLFFAMILGDAGYGMILLLFAVLLNVKAKKCSDMNALIYIMSGATVVWGALTGTWFGSEKILTAFPLLKFFVIPSLTNFPELFNMDSNLVQDNMMSLCFSIGAVHLSLARALCIFDKIKQKDISLLSDAGWLLNTVLLYLLSLNLVVGADVPVPKIAAGVAFGFVLVCLFASCEPGKPLVKGMLESLGSFFTNFLDTVSCFSNVMSYIRLFAVGLASLAIAQSFNDMASGLMSGITIPFGILILILGHAVNLVMGFLSIIVHGVRLNIMEFSGQVGVEWSGYKYEPFSLKGAVKTEETQRS